MIEGVLQNYNGRGLIDHGSRLLCRSSRAAHRRGGGDRRQSLIDESHRCRGETSKPLGERPRVASRDGLCAGQGKRKAHDNLDSLELARDREKSGGIPRPSRHSLNRSGQYSVQVTPCDANPDRADVNADANSGAHGSSPPRLRSPREPRRSRRHRTHRPERCRPCRRRHHRARPRQSWRVRRLWLRLHGRPRWSRR